MPDSPENDRFRLCFAEFSTCFVTLWSSAVLFGAKSLRYIPNQRNGRDVRRILRVRRSILLCSGAHECAVSRRLLRFSDSSLLSSGRLKGSWREVRRIIGLAAARCVMTDGAAKLNRGLLMSVSIQTGRIFAAAICSLSTGAALADWTAGAAAAPGAPELHSIERLQAATAPHLDGEAAPALDASAPFAVRMPCDPSDGAVIRLWSQMNAEERAHVWPYLDDVSQAIHWREMTKKERKALAKRLNDGERDDLRRRFSIDPSEINQAKHSAQSAAQRPHKLNREELRLMRQQIIEVHLEYAGRHEHMKKANSADSSD